jgi:NADH-quinone oxidoreductase subunit N
MAMTSLNYWELLKLAGPEAFLVVVALLVLGVDLGLMRGKSRGLRMKLAAGLSAAGCGWGMIWVLGFSTHGGFFEGMLVVDSLSQLVKAIVLGLTLFTVLIAVESAFTDHVGEYFAILLLATVGMMFLVSTENVLLIFVSLELMSLSLYILTAFNKKSPNGAEAALKYFLFGGMSAAFMLFGLSLIYGLTHELRLGGIAAALAGSPMDPLLVAAMVMVVAGFGFKIAAVPFHLWAPDAYEGAPGPSAAFIASGSKVASVFVFAKVMLAGFAGAEGSGAWREFAQGWMPLLAVIAAVSVILGNLAAVVQTSVRRLLGYSAIAHAGYMLLGLLGQGEAGMAALIYYSATYGLTVVGAFAVVSLVQEQVGNDRILSFAGLSERAPMLSFCMMIFMLSLAGIPPLAGFFGKFYLFSAAVAVDGENMGLLWLVILAIAMSAVSLYYYLQVLKQIYVAEKPAAALAIRASGLSYAAVGILALGVVILGCWPQLLLGRLSEAIRSAGF